MEDKIQDNKHGESTTKGKVTEQEVNKETEEVMEWYNELRGKIKEQVKEFVSEKPLSFRQVRELYLDLGRELEDVFFDQRIMLLVEELDKRYKKQ